MSRLSSSTELAAPPLFREIPAERPRERLLELDAARGLAILLVVVGHVVARSNDMPAGNAWYAVLKEAIYLFHMPLFMALTGITFALSLPRFRNLAEAGRFSMKRVERLFVPYVVFGLLIIGGKILAARYVHVDNPPGDAALLNLVVKPTESGVTFLWFIYVLSVYLLFIPALFQVMGRRPMPLFLVAVALNFAGPWPEEFMLDRVVEYLPFFAGGMLLWMERERWTRMPLPALWALTALFLVLLALDAPKWSVGAASVLPALGWMQRLHGPAKRWLVALGLASLAIYLMNTLAIGVAKALMLKVMPWHGVNFLLFFPVLTLAGVFVPMLVRALAARYARPAARYLT
ncbi:MAG TPA: acyltransferase [Burkholderiales bacterium]|nr:acyltransferase [Burkholderiales bacterium]